MSEAFDTDAGYYLWGKRRHHATLIPHTADGFVPMLSAHTPPTERKRFETVFETDGDRWYYNGCTFSPAEGKDLIEGSMQRSAKDLPFQVDGNVFFQAVRIDRGYRLYIVDPDIVGPSEKEITINFQERTETAHDVISDTEIATVGNVMRLTVPAGSIRIIDMLTIAR